MKSLEQFWHWVDNEKPARSTLSEVLLSGKLSQEVLRALNEAEWLLTGRASGWVYDPKYTPVLKQLSFAILQAWADVSESPHDE